MPAFKDVLISLLTVLLLGCSHLNAQSLRGIVIDRYSNLPVAGASVTSSRAATISSASGRFRLLNVRADDTLRVVCKGYRPAISVLGLTRPDSLRIYISQNSIVLNDVAIVGKTKYAADSLRLRREFESAFNYHAPGFGDIFIKKDPGVTPFQPYNKVVNGTSSIVSIDVLSVVGLLSRKSNPRAKLKKALEEQEANNYIDKMFTLKRITAMVPLHADSLRDFIQLYRPSLKQVKKMGDAELNLYIMESYRLFLKTYKPGGLLSLP